MNEKLLGRVKMFFVYAHRAFYGSHHFLKPGAGVISQSGSSRRYVFGQKAQVFERFEHTSFNQIVVREARFRTAEARVVGTGFTRLAVPKDAIATGVRHWPPTTYLVEQATAAFAETAVHFLSKTDCIRATRLYKIGKKGFGSVKIVYQHVFDPTG